MEFFFVSVKQYTYFIIIIVVSFIFKNDLEICLLYLKIQNQKYLSLWFKEKKFILYKIWNNLRIYNIKLTVGGLEVRIG